MNLLKEKKDEILFKEACKGNERSFEALYSRYTTKMLRRVSWKYRFMEAKYDDIVNDVWEKLWKACGNVGPNENFGRYLWTALQNNIYDYMRKDQTKNKYFQENSVDSDDSTEVNDVYPDTSVPVMEELAIIDQKIDAVEECLSHLSDVQREAFLLFVEGRTIREVAEILGIKEEAAKSRVRQARDRLKDCLPRDYYENN